MAHLDVGPPLKEYTAKSLFNIHQLIMSAVNHIDRTNFKKPVTGDDIINNESISMRKLRWREHVIPLVMAAPIYQTTLTTFQNIGGYFPWDPVKFPGGIWHLEADMAIANAAARAEVQITTGTVIMTLTTAATGITRVRSAALAMPASAANLWIQARTNNASHAASVAGAKLIFVPS